MRWSKDGRLHGDDYWAILATFMLLATAVQIEFMLPTMYESQRYEDGETPHWPPEEYARRGPTFLKLLFSEMIFYWTTLWCVKASFLTLIGRLVRNVTNFRRWWWVVMALTAGAWLGSVLNNVLACLPFKRRWSLDPNVTCTKPTQLAKSNIAIEVPTVFDIGSDLIIMTLAIWILSTLMLSRSKRVGIMGMFTLSSIIVCIAIIRVVLLSGLHEEIDLVLLVLWSWVEIIAAIFIGNIPPYGALLAKAIRHPLSSWKGSSNKDSGQQSSYIQKLRTIGSTPRRKVNDLETDIELYTVDATKRDGSVDSVAHLTANQAIHGSVKEQNAQDDNLREIQVTSEFSVVREPTGAALERHASRV